MFEKILL